MASNPFETSGSSSMSTANTWSSTENASSPQVMAGVSRSGFIRDPSGLLMSIIRTLAASEDDHQRELEKERLEEAFLENDEKLDALVSENYEELAVTIKQFGKIGDRISNSRHRIKKVRDNLQQCKLLLYCRQDELRKLWTEGVEHKKVLFLLDQIEKVKEAPQQIDYYLGKKFYLHATELAIQTLNSLQKELIQVEALGDIRNEIIGKKMALHDKFISELHHQIYVNSINVLHKKKNAIDIDSKNSKLKHHNLQSDDASIGNFDDKLMELEDLHMVPDSDPKKLMTILIESLSRLGKIPEAVEATKAKMDRHINMIVANATIEVTDLAFQNDDKVDDNKLSQDSKRLLQLLNSLFEKFRIIADSHFHVLQHLQNAVKQNRVDVQLYEMEVVWAKIQSVLQVMLTEYLDADNIAASAPQLGFAEGTSSLSAHFSRKKVNRPRGARLFRFDASSHAISMNNYLREQRAQQRSNSIINATSPLLEHAISTQKVCQPNARNITIIFAPLKGFIAEIEKALNYQGMKKCSLHEFITDYVQDIFIRQIQYELKKDFDAAMKVTEPLKVLADPAVYKNLGPFKNILQTATVSDQCLWFLYDLTSSLDSYQDHFLTMACSLVQEYKEMSIQSYRGIVQPEAEDQRVLSASWVRDTSVTDVLFKLDNWRIVYNLPIMEASSKSSEECYSNEAQFFIYKMEEEKHLDKSSLIEDHADLRAISSLHESLEWMAGRLELFIVKIELCAPQDILSMLTRLANDFKRMSEICLLCLHIEIRLRCFYHLIPMCKTSNYDIRGVDSLEEDSQITNLISDLNLAEENLSSTLQDKKYRFVLEGLGHLVASLLINSAKYIKRMSSSGVKKMCRNIFNLQQCLTNFTSSRESHLDIARQFYEMLYLMPDDLQTQVVEQGVRYKEEDYVSALNLIHRSKPGAGSDSTQCARVQRLRAIVKEQVDKKEHQEQLQNLEDVDI